MLVAFNFVSLPTVSSLLNYCGKTLTVDILGQSGQ